MADYTYRIKEGDNIMDIIVNMSEGNPGAATAMCELIKFSEYEGIVAILILDELKIYRSNIWVIYKDQCKEKADTMIMLLNAYKKGFLSEDKIKSIADRSLLSDEEMENLRVKVMYK